MNIGDTEAPGLLLVDDEKNVLSALRRLLHKSGNKIYTAESGTEALEIIDQNNIGVIVSDYQMPVMNGDEFLRKVSENKPEIVRIMLSGYADFDTVTNSINNGVIHKFMAKPWGHEEILQQIRIGFEQYNSNICEENQYNLHDTHCPITKLPNRASMYRHMELAIENAHDEEIHVIMLEIDSFSKITEKYSKQFAEELLKKYTSRLKESVNNKYFISQYDTVTFGIIVPIGNPKAKVTLKLKQLLTSLSRPFLIDEEAIHLENHAGVACYPIDDSDIHGLVNNALEALKVAKIKDNQKYQFQQIELDHAKLEKSLNLEEELERAIQAEKLQIFYQPQVLQANKQINGFEALLRWEHPKYGFISPHTFIPLIIELGLMETVNDWLFKNVSEFYSRLPEQLKYLNVGINISHLQLIEDNFAEHVHEIFSSKTSSCENFTLEFDERIFVSNKQQNKATLIKLREYGFKIALDDYGNGESSIDLIGDLPLDTFKIDRSFVQNITKCSEDLHSLKHLVDMIKSQDLFVIIEGVETSEQIDLLRNVGCDCIQGYFYSKPVNSEQLLSILLQ